MKAFWKKQKESGAQSPLTVKVVLWAENSLRGLANRLQKKTALYSARKKKTLLGLFCLVFATASGWVAYKSIQEKPLSAVAVTPMRFVPLLSDDEPPHPLPSKELERVHRFKRYIDSLGSTEKGQALRDSLLRTRPHLMDTVNYLESFYNNQQ